MTTPPTRIVRTNTIANIADFGAVPDLVGAALTNTQAIQRALEAGYLRICVPAGAWYFQGITAFGNPWLPAGAELFGEGKTLSTLRYVPTGPSSAAISLDPGVGAGRCRVHDLRLDGPVAPGDEPEKLGVRPTNTGIRASHSQYTLIHDVAIWDFQIGIDLAPDPGKFTGQTAIERFEINRCTTGIKLRDATNAVHISSGRIHYALVLLGSGPTQTTPPIVDEEGVGIDIEGTMFSNGPGGGTGVLLSQVTIENTPLCLRIVKSHDIVVAGCYFELFERVTPHTITRVRRIFEIDGFSERISILGSTQAEANVLPPPPHPPIPKQNWTPICAPRLPEGRGVIDLDSFHFTGDSPGLNAYGAGYNGATAPHASFIRNGDMSRDTLYWTTKGPATLAGIKTGLGNFVIGGRSLELTSTTDMANHVRQDFVVDHGVRTLTAMVRYRPTPGSVAPFAFRVEMVLLTGLADPDLATETVLGFYSDTDPTIGDFRVRALTARFDGADAGVNGPRRFRIKLYPYNVSDGSAVAGKQVHVDSVWVVDGEYAAPYRPYYEGIEVLPEPSRPVLFQAANTSSNLAATGIPASIRVPSNAVGMVTEMSIQGSAAFTTTTFLRVDDNSGANTAGEVREVHAYVNDRPTLVEYTVPFGKPMWSTQGASMANTISYHVRVKAWIYRL